MTGAVVIRPISAAETRPLRQQVLRPHQRAEDIVLPGDDEPDSLHLGAFAGGVLVGVASVFRQAPEAGAWHGAEGLFAPETAWRLRGMATLPEVRGTGLGGRLLEACLAHAAAHGGRAIWCTARTNVAGFYRRYGFISTEETFDLPMIGPHCFMWRKVD